MMSLTGGKLATHQCYRNRSGTGTLFYSLRFARLYILPDTGSIEAVRGSKLHLGRD